MIKYPMLTSPCPLPIQLLHMAFQYSSLSLCSSIGIKLVLVIHVQTFLKSCWKNLGASSEMTSPIAFSFISKQKPFPACLPKIIAWRMATTVPYLCLVVPHLCLYRHCSSLTHIFLPTHTLLYRFLSHLPPFVHMYPFVIFLIPSYTIKL